VAGWWVGGWWLVGGLVAGWLVGWLGWLVGWLAGWLAGWLVGWLVGWVWNTGFDLLMKYGLDCSIDLPICIGIEERVTAKGMREEDARPKTSRLNFSNLYTS